MRKILGIVLSLAIVAATAFVVAAPAKNNASATVERKFVIDGYKDYWYLDDEDAINNSYYFPSVDAWQGPTGHDPYFPNNDSDHAQVWTAYDYDYIYVLVKVHNERYPYMEWDDSYADVEGVNSSIVDSIAIWMDQDPYTQVSDWFFENTKDSYQCDSQFRYLIQNRRWHDLQNVVKYRAYGGVNFFDYVRDPSNAAVVLNDDDNDGTPDGYSLEIRYPRNHDLDPVKEPIDCYHFNVVCNFSDCDTDDNYCMALAGDWWISYDGTPKIFFQDGDANPFIGTSRPDPQVDNDVQNVIDLITALPQPTDITEADRTAVMAAYNAYNALSAAQKEEVTNSQKLIQCYNHLPEDQIVYGDVDGSGEVVSTDSLWALQSSIGKRTLDSAAMTRADVDGTPGITANDAKLILQFSIGMISQFPVQRI